MPDAELLARAAKGDLAKRDVLLAQVRRMLKDDRARALAVEFAGNWLDFRRFEDHNAVDRERFPSLHQRTAASDVRRAGAIPRATSSATTARCSICCTASTRSSIACSRSTTACRQRVRRCEWIRVDDATQYGRGGLLPMSVFLTQNAPGLRTSPVKRGYWVVRRVLGETIPPPPPNVPELPQDEAKADLPLREMLAKHRNNAACAVLPCAVRFLRARVRRLRPGGRAPDERPGGPAGGD